MSEANTGKHKSCIVFPEERLLIIRESYLAICDNDKPAAALLAVFQHWHQVKLAKGDDTWVYKSHTMLQGDLFNLYGVRYVGVALKLLLGKGYISRRRNPHYKGDNIPQYQFNVETVQNAVSALPTQKRNEVSAKMQTPPRKNAETLPEITNKDNNKESNNSANALENVPAALGLGESSKASRNRSNVEHSMPNLNTEKYAADTDNSAPTFPQAKNSLQATAPSTSLTNAVIKDNGRAGGLASYVADKWQCNSDPIANSTNKKIDWYGKRASHEELWRTDDSYKYAFQKQFEYVSDNMTDKAFIYRLNTLLSVGHLLAHAEQHKQDERELELYRRERDIPYTPF